MNHETNALPNLITGGCQSVAATLCLSETNLNLDINLLVRLTMTDLCLIHLSPFEIVGWFTYITVLVLCLLLITASCSETSIVEIVELYCD